MRLNNNNNTEKLAILFMPQPFPSLTASPTSSTLYACSRTGRDFPFFRECFFSLLEFSSTSATTTIWISDIQWSDRMKITTPKNGEFKCVDLMWIRHGMTSTRCGCNRSSAADELTPLSTHFFFLLFMAIVRTSLRWWQGAKLALVCPCDTFVVCLVELTTEWSSRRRDN